MWRRCHEAMAQRNQSRPSSTIAATVRSAIQGRSIHLCFCVVLVPVWMIVVYDVVTPIFFSWFLPIEKRFV